MLGLRVPSHAVGAQRCVRVVSFLRLSEVASPALHLTTGHRAMSTCARPIVWSPCGVHGPHAPARALAARKRVHAALSWPSSSAARVVAVSCNKRVIARRHHAPCIAVLPDGAIGAHAPSHAVAVSRTVRALSRCMLSTGATSAPRCRNCARATRILVLLIVPSVRLVLGARALGHAVAVPSITTESLRYSPSMGA